jgi:serine/threonine-protein kinase
MSAPTQPDPSQPGPEEVLPRRFGKYTLLRRMATGGMAELYLALQRSVAGFEKLIVIKRILPAMIADRGFIDMLLHEARVAATLSHPNIVQTLDVGQVEGAYFIALEHVHGEDLRSIVRQMKKKGVTEFPLEHAIAVILGMCAGLSYAHDRRDLDGTPLNIVHRDVSPQNVLVGFAGDVKVVDFGVAKSGTQTAEQTKSGQLKGKVPYMSPEQARGEEVDHRSDIFALGVMLFELTTGRRLFKGSTEFETLKMIIDRDYPRPSWVSHGYPAGLEAIVMKALEKDTSKRYQSARDMQGDLEAFVRDEKLPVSSIALAEFMKMLFEEKLAAQKEALMQGRQLADIIASEIVHGERTENGMESGRYSSSVTAGGAIALGSQPPPRAASKWPLVAIPIGLAALGVGLFFGLRAKPEQASATTQPATTSAEPAKRAKAKLTVESEPAGAHIWLNGEMRAEVTPATIDDLPIGTLDVKVGLEGYASMVDKVPVTDRETTKRNFTLKKGVVAYEVENAPANATAQVDNKPAKLPKFDVTPGEPHTLVLVATGFEMKIVKLATAEVGESKKLDGVMKKVTEKDPNAPEPVKTAAATTTTTTTTAGGTGKIIVIAGGGGWCTAAVDGRGAGPTPTGAIDVSAGSHSVTCTDSNGARQAQGATVKAGETTRVRFTVAN